MLSLTEKIAHTVSAKSRTRKWLQFLELAQTSPATTILDVGVNTTEYSDHDNFLERLYSYPERITAVGLEDDWQAFHKRYPEVTCLTADGTKLPFDDHSFDIAYSNAVIEHVGDAPRQLAFLQELHRVGKKIYLTTPNRHFPIEVHTRLPLAHWLPKPWFDAIVTWIGKSWAAGNYMHLLSEHDLRTLLDQVEMHDAQILRNRFCGLTMTFTVWWEGKDQC